MLFTIPTFNLGKGGKNRRRGKNENESEKRELVFKEDGQGEFLTIVWQCHCFQSHTVSDRTERGILIGVVFECQMSVRERQ